MHWLPYPVKYNGLSFCFMILVCHRFLHYCSVIIIPVIHIVENALSHERTKHIEIYWQKFGHLIRQKLQERVVRLQSVSLSYQLVDIFTKSLKVFAFQPFISKLDLSNPYGPACKGVIKYTDNG